MNTIQFQEKIKLQMILNYIYYCSNSMNIFLKDLENKCSFVLFEQDVKNKCISKFGHGRRFEMEHVNNKVLWILS